MHTSCYFFVQQAGQINPKTIFQAACTLAELARGAGGRNHRVIIIEALLSNSKDCVHALQMLISIEDDMMHLTGFTVCER